MTSSGKPPWFISLWPCNGLHVFRNLEATEKWTMPFMGPDGRKTSTSYGRMKDMWLDLHKFALARPSNTHFTYTEGGHTIQVSCPRLGPPEIITMGALKKLSQAMVPLLISSVEAFLPSGTVFPAYPDVDILDNSSRKESFIDSPDITSILKPIREHIWAALWTKGETRHQLVHPDGTTNRTAVQAFLKLDQNFLGSLALVLSWNAGNPMRAFQAADLCYRADGTHLRNMHLMVRLITFGWPKMKDYRGRRGIQASLGALPEVLTWPLIIYFGVFRDILISMIEHLFGSSPVGIDLLKTRIFVDTTSLFVRQKSNRTCSIWTGSNFCTAARASIPPDMAFRLKIDDKLWRQLFSSITAKHLPELTRQTIFGSNRSTALFDDELGLDASGLHTAFKMSRGTIEEFIAISQVCHGFWGVAPLSDRLHQQYFAKPFELLRRNRTIAAQKARHLVMLFYLLDYPASERAHRVRTILHDMPFLRGPRDTWKVVSRAVYSTTLR